MGVTRRVPSLIAVVRWVLLTVALATCGQPAWADPLHAGGPDSTVAKPVASDPSAAIDSARKRVGSGDLPGAIAVLAIYVAAHPRELAPARYLGDLYYRRSDFAAAERTYRGVLSVSPLDRETHNRLGGLYASEDRLIEAIDEFSKSLPETSAYGHLVDLHRRRGDLDAFVASYQRDADERPNDAQAQYALGTIYRSLRRSRDAVSYLQRGVQLAPRACALLSELGSAYIDVGEVSAAVDVLQRCLSIDSDNYSALINLGDAYIARNDPASSRPLFEHANRLRPDGPEALVDIGYLEDLDGRWQPAITYYLRALAADPQSRDAYIDLGYDYSIHHMYPLAEAAFLKGLSTSPDDGHLHFLLGETYALQGKRTLARAEYQRAAHSDDSDVVHAANKELAVL